MNALNDTKTWELSKSAKETGNICDVLWHLSKRKSKFLKLNLCFPSHRQDLVSGEHYELLVKAADGSGEEEYSLARVSLTIGGSDSGTTKKNAHPPRVTEDVMSSQVLESDPVGHLVALIVADDKVPINNLIPKFIYRAKPNLAFSTGLLKRR